MRMREIIEPHPGDKRYIRRDDEGCFTYVSRSLSRDNDQRAKNNSPGTRHPFWFPAHSRKCR